MLNKGSKVYLLVVILLFQSLTIFSENTKKPNKKKRPKVGLVLSGGGAKGFAYIGLLRVMEEVGLQVDYVGGTSIGSIVAGLYALGYSPDEIERQVRKQNWANLLIDKIPRKYIAYEEKEFMESSLVSFPFKKNKIGLKQAMYQGQQVNLLLNRFFSPGWYQTDFSKLQTPFLCVATNLFNGNAEVLKTGYLPMAIRASMSIPGYFSPTHYNGYYLVDGGIVDNYPANQLKEEGAQLIIGGDVQSGLADTITKLSTMTEIINQIVFFHGERANEEAAKLIDLNIRFDVDAGMMDFTKYESIIAYGEKVAREHYDDLKKLADSLNALEYVPLKEYTTKPLDSVYIADVVYEGKGKMSYTFLDGFFADFKDSYVAYDDIEHEITRVYGTKFFSHVFYELEPVGDNKANLIIKMKEGSPGYISASVHYDTDYGGSIRIDGIFRNIFGDRSKLFTELVVGSSPRLRALYLLSNGNKPGFGFEGDVYSLTFDSYNSLKSRFDFTNYKATGFLTLTLHNLYSFRAGVQYEYFQFKEDISVTPGIDSISDFNSYGNIFVKFRADTRNKAYFATSGIRAEFKAIYLMPLSSGWTQELFSNSLVAYIKYDQSIPITKKLSIKPGFFVGATLREDNLPAVQHWIGVGGLNDMNYIDTFVPFTGVLFVQKFGFYSAIARFKAQYNIYEKLYLTLRSDFGSTSSYIETIFEPTSQMFGYGLTASYDSFIGPVELTVMGSNLNPSLSLFLNIGFNF